MYINDNWDAAGLQHEAAADLGQGRRPPGLSHLTRPSQPPAYNCVLYFATIIQNSGSEYSETLKIAINWKGTKLWIHEQCLLNSG